MNAEPPIARFQMENQPRRPGYAKRSGNQDDFKQMTLFKIATIILVFPVCVQTAAADMGALAKYRGDWMINANRKYLVAVRWKEGSNTVEMRYAYSTSNCFRWTRKTWVMRHDPASNSYTATIQGRTTEHAFGEWDQETNTMTWTVGTRDGVGEAAAKPHGVRRIVHSFGDDEARWTNEYTRANGKTTSSRPMILNILVPYNEPEPSDAPESASRGVSTMVGQPRGPGDR